MKITEVDVTVFDNENSKMKGIASVKLDDCFVVRDIRILDRADGLFIAMPSRKNREGEYHDTAHPINQETRKMFVDAIFAEYDRKLAEKENS